MVFLQYLDPCKENYAWLITWISTCSVESKFSKNLICIDYQSSADGLIELPTYKPIQDHYIPVSTQ